MQDFMDILKGRRSIRKYNNREVPEDYLAQILESIMWSPSWANSQCWEVIVIRDSSIKEGLQDTLGEKNPARRAMTEAPVILALCGKKGAAGFKKGVPRTKYGDWLMFDLGIASQSACLAAYDLGLGTVIVGSFNHETASKILKIPETHELISMIILGYPEKEVKAPKRREIREFVHYDQY